MNPLLHFSKIEFGYVVVRISFRNVALSVLGREPVRSSVRDIEFVTLNLQLLGMQDTLEFCMVHDSSQKGFP